MTIYYNPHVDDFLAEPLQFRLLRRRPLKKYGFIFDEALQNGAIIRVLVDGTASGLVPEKLFHFLPRCLRIQLSNLEFQLWKYINGFGDEVKRVEVPRAPVDEVLFAFSYKAATGRFQLREETLRFYRTVVFHLSHYFSATSMKAENIQRIPNAYLAGDSDITGNAYFQRYFYWYKKSFLVLPFAVGVRFVNKQTWLTREPKAIATGSFHDLKLEQPAYMYADFMATTQASTYHPVRLAIYEAADQLWSQVNCVISPYRDYGQNRISRMLSHFRISQKKYFSINIVDLYNQHRYAVVGEELSGFPALGAFEAMASGCVLIAQSEYYAALQLVPLEHYLPYDGKIESLTKLLDEEVDAVGKKISENASEFVKKEFNPRAIYNRWIRELERLK